MDHWICPGCNKKISSNLKRCPYCQPTGIAATVQPATDQTETGPLPPPAAEEAIAVPDKYPALQFLIYVVKFIAILPLIVAIIGFFAATGAPLAGKIGAVSIAIIWSILIWACAEASQVFIDIEKNLRKLIETTRQS